MKLKPEAFWQALRELFHRASWGFIIRIVVILAIFIAAMHLADKYSKKKNRPDQYIRMSVYNPGSSGSMALREFFEALNLKTEKILRPMIKFNPKNNNSAKGTILIIEPDIPMQKSEVDSIELKAKDGYNIIIMTAFEHKVAPLFDKYLKTGTIAGGSGEHMKTAAHNETSLTYDRYNIFKDVKTVNLISKKRFVKWAGGWQRIAGDDSGAIAIMKKIDKGNLIMISDAPFVSNLNIRDSDNGVFIYRMVKHFTGKGRVYFDEYCHGFSQSFTLLYFIARSEYFYIVLQIVIFLILLAIPAGVKFGQYRKDIKPADGKIFYLSKGLAGLMESRKYSRELLYLMVKNYKKMAMIKQESASKDKLDLINKLTNMNKSKFAGKRMVVKICKIIKG
jgi:hypothetical protein